MQEARKNRNWVWVMMVALISILAMLNTIDKLGVHDNRDVSNYLSGGISLLKEKRAPPACSRYQQDAMDPELGSRSLVYPSIPFQLIAAISSGYLWGVAPKFSNITVASFLPFLFANLILYHTARLRLSPGIAVLYIALLTWWSWVRLYSETMIRPLSDPWLLGVYLGAGWAMLRGASGLSGILAGLGFLVRAQAIQCIVFLPLLAPRPAVKHAAKYVLAVLAAIILLHTLFVLLLNVPFGATGAEYYRAWLERVSWKSYWHGFSITVAAFREHYESVGIFVVTLPLNLLALMYPLADRFTRKVNTVALLTAVTTIIVGWHGMSVVHGRGHDPRYLVYAIPYSILGVILAAYDNARHLQRSGRKIMVWLTSVIGVVLMGGQIARILSYDSLETKFKGMDIREEVSSFKISPNATVALPGEGWPLVCQLYALYGTRRHVLLPLEPQVFLISTNNGYIDYIMIQKDDYPPPKGNSAWYEFGKATPEFIDAGGNRYDRVLSFEDGPAHQYVFFRRDKCSSRDGKGNQGHIQRR
jgi:hypothetical protein